MFLTSFERNMLPFVLFWKDHECFIRILTWCGKYVTGKKKPFLMKKSATMGVLGEVCESKRSLKMNSNLFQRYTPTVSIFLASSCSCECIQNKFTHQQCRQFGHLYLSNALIWSSQWQHIACFSGVCVMIGLLARCCCIQEARYPRRRCLLRTSHFS